MTTDFGGRLMVGVDGMEPTPAECDRLQSPLVGGCILFGKGYARAEQVAAVAAQAREAAGRPILVATDHEGGRVQRFRGEGFTVLPAMGEVGRLFADDPGAGLALAHDCGLVMAGELRAQGVDLSFAPILDLDHGQSAVIGDRAFAAGPAEVSRLAAAFVQGMNAAGMRSVGKHFPGHGFCAQDSHVEYPSDPRAPDAILNADALPYQPGSEVGIDAVMTAHVLYPAADPEIATYSHRWLSGILRERIGFEGLVVSDDLHMAGAGRAGGMPARIRAAVEAGCDLALVCHEWDRDQSERELPCSAERRNPWLALAPSKAAADRRELEEARTRIAEFGHG